MKKLINSAMDGELTAAEQAELDKQLSQSEELREYQAGMKKLDTLLTELPTEILPAELHDQIVRSVRLPAPPVSRKWNTIIWPGFVRYGFPVAAALLLAVGIYQFGSDTVGPADRDRMIGTIAPGQADELGAFSWNNEQLSSTVTLQRRSSAMILNVELDSSRAVELNIDLSGTGLVYEAAVAKSQRNLEYSTDASHSLRVRSFGRQKFSVLLHRANDTTPAMDEVITLEYSSDGKLIQKGTLTPSW